MAQSAYMSDLVTRARKHKMSPVERRAQRVSLVMGLRSHRSTLTKEKVDTLLTEIEGTTA